MVVRRIGAQFLPLMSSSPCTLHILQNSDEEWLVFSSSFTLSLAGRNVVLCCGEAQPVGAGVELSGSSVVLRCGRVAIAGQILTL